MRRVRIAAVLTAALCAVPAAFVGCHFVSAHGGLYQAARSVYRKLRSGGASSAYAESGGPIRAERPLVLYDDRPGAGWEDWSWAQRDLTSTTHVYRGTRSIRMTPVGFKGVYLHHALLSTEGYGTLEAFVYGEAPLTVSVADARDKFGKAVPLNQYLRAEPGLPAGWRVARVPLADLGLPKTGDSITGVVFQAAEAAPSPEVYLDEISLRPDLSLPTAPTEATIAVTIDADSDRHPISPLIYGMAFPPKEYLTDLRLGLNRWGGNARTRYNWIHGNASNSARDWEWRNKVSDPEAGSGPSAAADRFHQQNQAAGTATLLTIPTIGWVAKDASNESQSFKVPDDGGPPLTTADGAIAGYDPTENRRRTSLPSRARKGKPFSDSPSLAEGVVYQDEWVHHLVQKFGTAAKGGVQLYAMDNEPDLWSSTHTDIHPAQMGYDDLLSNFLEYATAVKAVDPTARITGPTSWGWTGYQYSPLDEGADQYRTHADRKRHGDEPFLLWFLKQIRAHDARAGKRTLDVLDVHYYPQGKGIYPGSGTPSSELQARRVRATRSLWDPSYVDESWIGESVRLIPRLKEWIAAGYPGTQLGISEWNFGGETDISGALAAAEALGIYGREGIDFASYWTSPPKNSPACLAFKLYRNADGQGHGFGSVSCRAATAAPEKLSCFAAEDPMSGALTLILVNMMSRATVTAPVTIQGGSGKWHEGRVWAVSAADPAQITVHPTTADRQGRLTLALPPYSVSLVRLGRD